VNKFAKIQERFKEQREKRYGCKEEIREKSVDETVEDSILRMNIAAQMSKL
jgi:hypothetical protein